MRRILPYDAILIPKSAHKVYTGEIFDVYQWQQELFDGTSTTFEMLKRPDTAIVIGIRDGKLLLLQETQPHRHSVFHFPGGRARSTDESILEAAKRELKEETGYSFSHWQLIHVSQPANKIEWFVSWFIASGFIGQTKQELDGGEHIEVVLEPFENALNIVKNTNKTEAKYIPAEVLEAKSVDDLLAIPEFDGDKFDGS